MRRSDETYAYKSSFHYRQVQSHSPRHASHIRIDTGPPLRSLFRFWLPALAVVGRGSPACCEVNKLNTNSESGPLAMGQDAWQEDSHPRSDVSIGPERCRYMRSGGSLARGRRSGNPFEWAGRMPMIRGDVDASTPSSPHSGRTPGEEANGDGEPLTAARMPWGGTWASTMLGTSPRFRHFRPGLDTGRRHAGTIPRWQSWARTSKTRTSSRRLHAPAHRRLFRASDITRSSRTSSVTTAMIFPRGGRGGDGRRPRFGYHSMLMPPPT